MMVTSESTALAAMSSATSTATPPDPATPSPPNVGNGIPPVRARPNMMNTSTGTTMVPMAPSGSRRKILISSQVSCQRPRRRCMDSVPHGVAGEHEEDILEIRKHGAELGDSDPLLGEALDHLGHEIVPEAANGIARVEAGHRCDARDARETLGGSWVGRGEHHATLRTVAGDQPVRRVDVDDAVVVDYRHSDAETS